MTNIGNDVEYAYYAGVYDDSKLKISKRNKRNKTPPQMPKIKMKPNKSLQGSARDSWYDEDGYAMPKDEQGVQKIESNCPGLSKLSSSTKKVEKKQSKARKYKIIAILAILSLGIAGAGTYYIMKSLGMLTRNISEVTTSHPLSTKPTTPTGNDLSFVYKDCASN